MTLYETLSIILSLLSLGIVAASIFALWRQIKAMNTQTHQLQKALEVSAESSLDTMLVAVAEWTMRHPELRPKTPKPL